MEGSPAKKCKISYLVREYGFTTQQEAERWIADPRACVEEIEQWMRESSSYYSTQRLTTPPPWEPAYDGKPVAFMMRFANLWMPRELPIVPETMVGGPTNLVSCVGFPRRYTALIELPAPPLETDAFLMLIKHGMADLVDRVVIHLAVDFLRTLHCKTRKVVELVASIFCRLYGNNNMVGWLLRQRYENGVFEAALLHAIGLPYMLKMRRIVPIQTWPCIGNAPLVGNAVRAWSIAMNANQWRRQEGSDSIAIQCAFEEDSLMQPKNRVIPASLTFTLVLQWLLHHGQIRSAFQMARTCRTALCCYHSLLIPTYWGFTMEDRRQLKRLMMRRYFGEEGARLLSSDKNGFIVQHSLVILGPEPYHIPAVSDWFASAVDPYHIFSTRLSQRRRDVFAVAARAAMIFSSQF
jgi:hypothetical protein